MRVYRNSIFYDALSFLRSEVSISKSIIFIDKKLQMQNIIINLTASKYEKNGKYGDYKERRHKNYYAK